MNELHRLSLKRKIAGIILGCDLLDAVDIAERVIQLLEKENELK